MVTCTRTGVKSPRQIHYTYPLVANLYTRLPKALTTKFLIVVLKLFCETSKHICTFIISPHSCKNTIILKAIKPFDVFLSFLNYCIYVWGRVHHPNMSHISVIQNTDICIINGVLPTIIVCIIYTRNKNIISVKFCRTFNHWLLTYE